MKTELKQYTVEQICDGFEYNELEGKGLYGLSGTLTIQPEYQRNYIYADGKIIEIQTRQFNKMRNKLEAFLPLYPVTIVYPIPREKWLIWIDEDSGELSKKRKSPKKGSTYQAFKELYKIKMFLKDPNIRFKFVLVNM